jgi:hypothetical protein
VNETTFSLIIAFLLLNGMALILAGPKYTAWTIRTRNRVLYALLHRKVSLGKAERADELAEPIVRWVRPVALIVANAVWVVCLWQTLHPY